MFISRHSWIYGKDFKAVKFLQHIYKFKDEKCVKGIKCYKLLVNLKKKPSEKNKDLLQFVYKMKIIN